MQTYAHHEMLSTQTRKYMLLSGQELGKKKAKQLEASRKQLWLSQRAAVNQASKYRNSE